MDDVSTAFAESKSYFPTALQQFQFFDKYSRFNHDKGRRETWTETVDRTVEFLKHISENKLEEKIYEEIKEGILHMEVMPSMRLLATAGPAAERNNIAIYNCSFITLDKTTRFADAVYILMSGTGLGFSVESRYVDQLPPVSAEWTVVKTDPIIVEDTSEGWANAVQDAVSHWWSGTEIDIDYSNIRKSGSILKTKGGRASGPESLKALMEFLHKYIKNAAGRKLRPIEVHDMMCKVAEVIVSGGHRRSALISLFDFDDEEMMNAKNGEFWIDHPERFNANNSAVVPGDISQLELARFMMTVLDGKSGEPGIFVRDNAISKRPSRRKEAVFGTNPSLEGNTRVWTTKGVFKIKELENKRFKVKTHTGAIAPAHCVKTGENKQLWEIKIKGGHRYYCTKEHEWPVVTHDGDIVAKVPEEIEDGDSLIISDNTIEWDGEGDYNSGFFLGWLYGDGYIRKEQSSITTVKFGMMMSQEDYREPLIRERLIAMLEDFGSSAKFSMQEQEGVKPMYTMHTSSVTVKEVLKPTLKSDGLPDWIWNEASSEFLRGVVDGLFSSDGSVGIGRNGKVKLSFTSAYEALINDVADLLGMFGIYSTISYRERNSEDISFPNGKTYKGKKYSSYDLRIDRPYDLMKFRKTFRLSHSRKDSLIKVPVVEPDNRLVRIVSVTPTDRYEDVWDISVDHENHSFALPTVYTKNCGEIVLRPNEFCNLSSVVVRPNDDFASLMKKARLATIIGTIQAAASDFPIIDPEFKKNAEEERLIGVDLNGQLDNEAVRKPGVLMALKHVVVKTNKAIADKLGIAQAAATTTVKPSGNSSQLLDTASGIHPRFAPYYIRRVRVNAHSPLRHLLEDAGVDIKPENGQEYETASTFVVSFPVKAPDGSVFSGDWNAIEQLEYWKSVKEHYTEHNPSITITYTDNEVVDIIKWVSDNFEYIGGISFLPANDAVYEQMPFEEISRSEYVAMLNELPDIDFSKIVEYEAEDLTESAQELACSAGVCMF